MNNHKINELITLLREHWLTQPNLNLVELLTQLTAELKDLNDITELSDDRLIYHLKMRDRARHMNIPGLEKDHEEDFKAALLKARGVCSK